MTLKESAGEQNFIFFGALCPKWRLHPKNSTFLPDFSEDCARVIIDATSGVTELLHLGHRDQIGGPGLRVRD